MLQRKASCTDAPSYVRMTSSLLCVSLSSLWLRACPSIRRGSKKMTENPKPQTLNSKPQTQNGKRQASDPSYVGMTFPQNPKPKTANGRQASYVGMTFFQTQNPKPETGILPSCQHFWFGTAFDKYAENVLLCKKVR